MKWARKLRRLWISKAKQERIRRLRRQWWLTAIAKYFTIVSDRDCMVSPRNAAAIHRRMREPEARHRVTAQPYCRDDLIYIFEPVGRQGAEVPREIQAPRWVGRI